MGDAGDDAPGVADGTGDDGSGDGSSDDTDGSGDGGNGNPTEGGVGTELTGDLASFAVEYVEPVENVVEYVGPDSYNDGQYVAHLTQEDLREEGFIPEGAELHAVGVVIENVSDALLDVSTMLGTSESNTALGSLPGRSQEQWLNTGRDSSRYAVPGEVQRGEVMFAFSGDPGEYELTFEPFEVGTDQRERLTVDLGSGEEATASFSQDPPTQPYGEVVTVGDFEVTVHSIERVASIEGTESEDIFGPRSEYEYVRIDCDVTRVTDAMSGSQHWTVGATDDEGHAFWWHNLYSDALDINRPRPNDLYVDDSEDGYVFGFPVENAFEPTYLTIDSVGPFEDDPNRRPARMFRSLWSLE